jgi:DNA-binding NarL/FixJ family response regulator
VQLLDKEFHDADPNHPDALAKGNQSFACMVCHGVMYHSRLNYETWNRLVSHLSAGLLFGHEVPRPSWYGQQRKRPFVTKLRRAPSNRREQIRRMLLDGFGVTKIALELGLSKSTVGTYASQIYRQEGVKGVEALRAKVGLSHMAPRMRGVL